MAKKKAVKAEKEKSVSVTIDFYNFEKMEVADTLKAIVEIGDRVKAGDEQGGGKDGQGGWYFWVDK